jgi:hypothetical protein
MDKTDKHAVEPRYVWANRCVSRKMILVNQSQDSMPVVNLEAQGYLRGRRCGIHGELGVITCLMSPAKIIVFAEVFRLRVHRCCRHRCELTRR